jgi:hypothetical protein
MSEWPKIIYNKGEPELLERVDKATYYRRIYDGWGGVSAAKISERVHFIIDSFGMTRNQFWEFLNLRIDELPVSKDAINRVLAGRSTSDSRVDHTLLMVLATATSQPLAWFTQEKERAVRKPWRRWDFEASAERARKLSFFQVAYASDKGQGRTLITAYDAAHARGIIATKYPEFHILSVVEIPARAGIEIR